MTTTDAEQALEAAHIYPYQGTQTNHISNGILLRADIHVLFDLRLITVNSYDMTIIISGVLSKTVYAELLGKSLLLPENG